MPQSIFQPLETFRRQLGLVRALGIIEPEKLGRKMAECFIVETRFTLVKSDEVNLELPYVGVLYRKKEKVLFKPDEELRRELRDKKARFLLAAFLTEQIEYTGDPEKYAWGIVFRQSETPYSGMDLLGRLGSDLIRFQVHRATDPFLEKFLQKFSLPVLSRAICCAIHDAICSGSGIKLETIGVFKPYPEFTFEEDNILRDRIESFTASLRINPAFPDFKVSEEILGPPPKIY